jgi:hypothetical protein
MSSPPSKREAQAGPYCSSSDESPIVGLEAFVVEVYLWLKKKHEVDVAFSYYEAPNERQGSKDAEDKVLKHLSHLTKELYHLSDLANNVAVKRSSDSVEPRVVAAIKEKLNTSSKWSNNAYLRRWEAFSMSQEPQHNNNVQVVLKSTANCTTCSSTSRVQFERRRTPKASPEYVGPSLNKREDVQVPGAIKRPRFG